MTGAALFWYFANEKERILELKRASWAEGCYSGCFRSSSSAWLLP